MLPRLSLAVLRRSERGFAPTTSEQIKASERLSTRCSFSSSVQICFAFLGSGCTLFTWIPHADSDSDEGAFLMP